MKAQLEHLPLLQNLLVLGGWLLSLWAPKWHSMALNRLFPSRALGSFTGPYVPFGLWTVPRQDFISVICEAQHEVSSLKLNAHLEARLPVRSQANQSHEQHFARLSLGSR